MGSPRVEEGRGWSVGVDVGGTFTDIIAVNRATGEARDGKVLSTTSQEIGVLAAVASLDIDLGDIDEIVHGHTVGINAVLSRRGAKTALVCTMGHRDLLDIGRMNREFGPHFYDPTWLRPHQERPIVERSLRIGVIERMDATGSTLVAVDPDSVRAAAATIRAAGVESVGVCFLHSYVNQRHEQTVVDILRSELPDVYIQSSALYPVSKEHERTTTVALDAYAGPAVTGYLSKLEGALATGGFAGRLWIMMMNGGVGTITQALAAPVFQLVSGPVGGVSAAVQAAADAEPGERNLLTMDVGGTSTDVAIIDDGATPLTDLWTVEHGLTLTMPLVDVGSVGSGAGSKIVVDQLGSLRVGPDSAGSTPGPASYGRGGQDATLTDACLVLGVIQADLFANGAIQLDATQAHAALARAGAPIGLDSQQTAAAAYAVACEDIAAKIQAVSVYRGLDIRDFSLLPFGAAGPMLANAVAKNLGVGRVVVPTHPGQLSAMGLLTSDLRVTRGRSPMITLQATAAQQLEELYQAEEEQIRSQLSEQGIPVGSLVYERAFFAMYAGQTWDNRLRANSQTVTAASIEQMIQGFHEFYRSSYGFAARELPVVLTSIEVTGHVERGADVRVPGVTEMGQSLLRSTTVFVPGFGETVADVYRRERLSVGDVIHGPALISERYATTLVLPDWTLEVSKDLALTITDNAETIDADRVTAGDHQEGLS